MAGWLRDMVTLVLVTFEAAPGFIVQFGAPDTREMLPNRSKYKRLGQWLGYARVAYKRVR